MAGDWFYNGRIPSAMAFAIYKNERKHDASSRLENQCLMNELRFR